MGMDASATIGLGIKIPEDLFAEFCENAKENHPDMQEVVENIWLKLNGFKEIKPVCPPLVEWKHWWKNLGGQVLHSNYSKARTKVLKEFPCPVATSFAGTGDDYSRDEFLFVAGTTTSGDWDDPTEIDLEKFKVSQTQMDEFCKVVHVLFPNLDIRFKWLMICRYF